MKRRNWADLGRLLVDTQDLSYTEDSIDLAVNQLLMAMAGEGVLRTAQYPSPFGITMSGVVLGGAVSEGIAVDPTGQMVRIDTGTSTPQTFIQPAADLTNPRWDLLVLRYVKSGDTLIPKPSAPLTNVYLNLHDDFALVIIPGTPAPSPAYPAKGADDIILAGLKVPSGSTIGTAETIDLSIREKALSLFGLGLEQKKLVATGNPSVWNLPPEIFVTNEQNLIVGIDGAIEFDVDDWTYAVVGGVGVVTFGIPVSSGQTPYGIALTGSGSGSGGGGGGGGGSSLPEIHGSESSPVLINPAIGVVPSTAPDQMWFIRPSTGSGQVDITNVPPIAPGTNVGQRLTLISVSSANYLRIPAVAGIKQTGPVDFGPYDQIAIYVWGGVNWILQSTAV